MAVQESKPSKEWYQDTQPKVGIGLSASAPGVGSPSGNPPRQHIGHQNRSDKRADAASVAVCERQLPLPQKVPPKWGLS